MSVTPRSQVDDDARKTLTYVSAGFVAVALVGGILTSIWVSIRTKDRTQVGPNIAYSKNSLKMLIRDWAKLSVFA